MESNVVIVHGYNEKEREKIIRGFAPQNERNWVGWAKGQLEKQGINCENPLMPNNMSYGDWKKVFEKNKIDENSILIGHSAGGAFLVRWLSETKQKIKKLILVAPARKLPGIKEKYLDFYSFNFDKNIINNIGEVCIFVSDNESEGIKQSVKLYEKDFGVKAIELEGRGHFTFGDMGTKEFPELLDEVLKD
ncbi:alpha/beta hydrolase [Candidatus Pacearchaeota archaeon]|nr:alpha/beta hydrolase [Candidatus Pacearchaeota archaeon]